MNNISIIIPLGFRKTKMNEISNIKYFVPRIIHINEGDILSWINKDSVSHYLVSGNVDEGKPDGILNTKEIPPEQSFSQKIDEFTGIIHYYCIIHPAERGSIIVNGKNTDRYRFEQGQTNLDITENNENENWIQETQTKLSRYVDPTILETLGKPNSDILKNKVLTIVFWDISGFSKLCVKFTNQPHLIVGFLQEFFNQANNTIHKYAGILDKFLGDGIMGIFGYTDDIYESNENLVSSIDAINCAIELNRSFEEIKNKWIGIWRDQFDLITGDIHLKCAIHRGNTLVGKIITHDRDQFTALGSTVNLTSRLVDKADSNQIIISSELKDKLDNIFRFKKITINSDNKIKSFEYVKEYYELLF